MDWSLLWNYFQHVKSFDMQCYLLMYKVMSAVGSAEARYSICETMTFPTSSLTSVPRSKIRSLRSLEITSYFEWKSSKFLVREVKKSAEIRGSNQWVVFDCYLIVAQTYCWQRHRTGVSLWWLIGLRLRSHPHVSGIVSHQSAFGADAEEDDELNTV